VTVAWERALSECEDRLDAASAALDNGRAPSEIAPFSAPTVADPIPAALAERARALVARGAALEKQLTDERERIRSELRRLPRMPRAPRETRFEAQA